MSRTGRGRPWRPWPTGSRRTGRTTPARWRRPTVGRRRRPGGDPSSGSGATSASHDGSKKYGNDSRLRAAGVAHTVRRRPVAALGQPVEHVADVAHEHAGFGRHVEPLAGRRAHLEPAETRPGRAGSGCRSRCVRPTPHSAAVVVVGQRRVVEDPEQHRRIGGEVLLEPVAGRPSPSAIARMSASATGRSAVEPASDRRRRAAPGGNRLAPCRGVPATTRG